MDRSLCFIDPVTDRAETGKVTHPCEGPLLEFAHKEGVRLVHCSAELHKSPAQLFGRDFPQRGGATTKNEAFLPS